MAGRERPAGGYMGVPTLTTVTASLSKHFRNSLELQITAGVGMIGLIGGSICVYVFFATGNYPLFVVLLAGTVGIMSALGLVSVDQFVEVRDLENKVERIEKGDFDVDLATDRDDEIGELYASVANMRDALEASLSDAETAQQRHRRTNERLERRAEEYGAVMAECADGDLTRRLDTDADNEAMRSIAASFNEMMDDLEPTLRDVKTFADAVATSSEQARDRSIEMQERSEAVADAMKGIAKGSKTQRERLEDVTAEIEDFSSTSESVAAAAKEVAETSESVADRSSAARQAAVESLSEVERIEASTGRTIEEVATLSDLVEQIDEITGFVSDVAAQINLLAVNATIEASREGEDAAAGSAGFDAVAREVKSLSDSTKEGADEIADLVAELETQSGIVVEEVESTEHHIASGLSTIEAALEETTEITAAIEDVDSGVQEITVATERQASSAETVRSAVDDVAQISQETADAARTASQAVEAHRDLIESLAKRNETLRARATDLDEAAGRFSATSPANVQTPSE
jgi:methyl-accepting chemotaxis protein